MVTGSYPAEAPVVGLNDVVIIPRTVRSGDFANNAAEIDSWNALPCKVLLANAYLTRNSRWGWIDSGSIASASPDGPNTVLTLPVDSIFSGVSSNPVELYSSNVSLVTAASLGGGTLLASHSAGIVAAQFRGGSALATATPAGFAVSQTTHAADRLYFALPSNDTALTADGFKVLTNILEHELELTPIKNRATTAGAPLAEILPTGVFGYEHFKLNHGLSGAQALATNDKDGDGVINVLEFAFGLDPLKAEAHTWGLTHNATLGDLELLFRRRIDAPHLSYAVKSSTNLQTWSSHELDEEYTQTESVSPSVEAVRSTVDVSSGTEHYFRLEIILDDSAINHIYTIDNQADFDAYKTHIFEPGDLILFKRGQIFSGKFAPRGSGTASQPIRIASYGEGGLPIINALGVNVAAIHLKNVQYWEVHNIEVTNTDGSNQHQGKIRGIYIETDDNRPQTVMNHLHIKNCYVHDVNGRTLDSDPDRAKRHGGIHVHTFGSIPTMIHDLQIVGNTVERTGGVGIGLSSDFNRVDASRMDYLWTSVYVAQNFINDTDRNNMIIRQSVNPLVEYNVLANSSRENTGHSMFNFDTVGLIAQHNEAYGNIGNESSDRGGFDADYSAMNTVYQYNYSHDNMWFIGIMKRWNKTVDVRYNISQNDQEGFIFFGFNNNTDCEDVRIYNNVFYTSPSLGETQLVAENRRPHNTKFYNNIFYFGGGGVYGSAMNTMQNTEFSHNAYFGIPPWASDAHAVTMDPMLLEPGSGSLNIDMTDPNRLSGYRLQPGSPCIDAGKSTGTGYVFAQHDFWGNPVPTGSSIDIGVHEF